jgi:hypothetical protein
VVVLVGQILHETGFVFGTYQAFIDTKFLEEGRLHGPQGLVPCTGITVWFSGAFIVDKVEEAQQM